VTRFTYLLATCFIFCCTLAPALARTPTYPCRIINEYPHNPETYTQGLFFHEGKMYESSGGFGESYLAMIEPESGRTLRLYPLEGKYFAEGISRRGDALYMLTWLSGTGFIHSLETLERIGTFEYRQSWEKTEGWGLTSDGTQFIMSTGKPRLRFHTHADFKHQAVMTVLDNGEPVRLLNELEYVGGTLLANVWKKDVIAVIALETGNVQAWIDLSPLRERLGSQAGVANGIAYDEHSGRLFVTGKHWDKLFEITMDAVLWRQPVTPPAASN
tara:strand:- start:239 stop:1054 length:816 start_codon:yes stop_codon:yes gene_type:complete